MTRHSLRWVPAALVTSAAVFVAVQAFRLAYAGSKAAALDMGVPPGAAGAYPWCIEGVIVVASTATIVLNVGQRRLAWTVLVGFTAISMGVNILHAVEAPNHNEWSGPLAVVPPLALPLCVRLAERVLLTLFGPLNVVARSNDPGPGGHPIPDGGVAPPEGAGGRAAPDPPRVRPPDRPELINAAAVDAPGPESTDSPVVHPDGCPPNPVDESSPAVHPQSDSSPVDSASTVQSTVQPESSPASTRQSSGRPVHRSPARPPASTRGRGGRSSGRQSTESSPLPDWRRVDWAAVAHAHGVKKARAYQILQQDPGAADRAREQLVALNGDAP